MNLSHHHLLTPEPPPCELDLSAVPISGQADLLALTWRELTRQRADSATHHEQEHLRAAHAQAEAELKRELEHTISTVRTQVQSALNHLERGMLGAAAAVLAELNAGLNTVTTDGMRQRTPTLLAAGIQADGTPPDDFLLAIRQYVVHFADLHSLKLALACDPTLCADHLPQTLRLHVVRVLQALLDNVAGHAQSQQLDVQLACTPAGVRLTVRDDGVGFDPTAILPGRADAGFALLRQRLDLLHGSLTIAAAPGVGVEVSAFFPLAPVLAAQATLRGKRVVLAVENPLTREGLRVMLLEHGMVVDAVAACRAVLLAPPPATQPDLVLFDIDLPGAAAPGAIQQVRAAWPQARAVMLVAEGHPSLPAALHNGADGYVLKSLPTAAFFDALAQVIDGASTLTPDLATQLLAEFRQHDVPPNLKSLTERQREVLQLVAGGLTYDQIAVQLIISARTVRYHVEQLRKQLGLANRSQVAMYARRHQI